MKISFVGAGKVGTALGKYFDEAGLTIEGYYSLTRDASKRAADYVGCKVFESIDELLLASDVVFLTTNDSSIRKACETLVSSKYFSTNHRVGHTSGAHDVTVLASAIEKGANVFSMHPLQAFADIEKAVNDLSKTYFGLEGDSEIAKEILRETGNPYMMIPEGQKGAYHMSAVVLSNYLVTIMDYGVSILSSMGIDPEVGFKAMKPLIDGSFENINTLGTKAALTGPIARGDASTLKIHLEALTSIDECDDEVYKALGRHAVKIARERGLEESLIDALMDSLK